MTTIKNIEVYKDLPMLITSKARGYYDYSEIKTFTDNEPYTINQQVYDGLSYEVYNSDTNPKTVKTEVTTLPDGSFVNSQTAILMPYDNGKIYHSLYFNDNPEEQSLIGCLYNYTDTGLATVLNCFYHNDKYLLTADENIENGVYLGQVEIPEHDLYNYSETSQTVYDNFTIIGSGVTVNQENGQAENFSSSSYLDTGFIPQLPPKTPWKMRVRFKYVKTSSFQVYLSGTTYANAPYIAVGTDYIVDCGISNGSGRITYIKGTTILDDDIYYTIELSFDGNNTYTVRLKRGDNIWNEEATYITDEQVLFGANLCVGRNGSGYSRGKIDLSTDTYLEIDGKKTWIPTTVHYTGHWNNLSYKQYEVNEDATGGITFTSSPTIIQGENGNTIFKQTPDVSINLGTDAQNIYEGFGSKDNKTADEFCIRLRMFDTTFSVGNGIVMLLSDNNLFQEPRPDGTLLLGYAALQEGIDSPIVTEQSLIMRFLNNEMDYTCYTDLPEDKFVTLNEWFILKYKITYNADTSQYEYTTTILNDDGDILGTNTMTSSSGAVVDKTTAKILDYDIVGKPLFDVDLSQTGFKLNNEWVWRPVKEV